MLNYSKAFIVFSIWALIAITTHYFITQKYFNNCSISSKKLEEITELVAPEHFFVLNESDTIYTSYKGIVIYKNSDKTDFPSDLKNKLDSIINSNYRKKLLFLVFIMPKKTIL